MANMVNDRELMVEPHIRIATLYSDLKDRLNALENDRSAMRASRQIVDDALNDGKTYYGINTGFGILATQRIGSDQLKQLQKNLILSHAVGVGDMIPPAITKLMLDLKIHSLAYGYSGISESTFERLLWMSQNEIIPAVPEKGSVGASGDLAPLAHLFLPLLGLGYVWDRKQEKRIPADRMLADAGLEPLELQAKDGLSLINGTQQMAAYGAYILEQMVRVQKTADVIGAMSLEALQGSIKPFDERIHAIRPHPGQQTVATNIRRLLQKSEILESHRNCGKVQDPYCLRCIPQVHGASRDAVSHAISVFETELNSVTDNPLVFGEGDIISGGNFHGQPLALALDYLTIAMAELASISERRTYLLLGGHDGLPKLLMEHTGINSGFMIPQYTSAALVSENKVLAHPASVDSIPTSMGQEDHVSMGSIGALKALKVFQNLLHVLSIELFTASQALDFRKPLKPGQGVELAHNYVRDRISHAKQDYFYQVDIGKIHNWIESGSLLRHLQNELKSDRLD